MDVLIVLLDLFQAVQHPVCYVPGGVSSLLLDLEQDPVLPVDLGVGFVRIILPLHIRDVGKPDGIDPFPLYQYQLAQLFYGRKLIAYPDQVINSVLLHIARRHVEVLRRQQRLYGLGRQHGFHVRGSAGRVLCFFEFLLLCLDGRFSHRKLGGYAAHLQGRGQLGRSQLGSCLGQRQRPRVQLLFRLIQHRLGHIQLGLLVRNDLAVCANLSQSFVDHPHSGIVLVQQRKLGSQGRLGKLQLSQLLQIGAVRYGNVRNPARQVDIGDRDGGAVRQGNLRAADSLGEIRNISARDRRSASARPVSACSRIDRAASACTRVDRSGPVCSRAACPASACSRCHASVSSRSRIPGAVPGGIPIS